MMKWFSDSRDTLEAAQKAVGKLDFFSSYGAFRTPDGKYVTGDLRLKTWSQDEFETIAAGIRQVNGYELVAYVVPIVMFWKPYPHEGKYP